MKITPITKELIQNNLTNKPGWVRLSLHPTMTNEELLFICNAIQKVTLNYQEWQKDYQYNSFTNEYESLIQQENIEEDVKKWFRLE